MRSDSDQGSRIDSRGKSNSYAATWTKFSDDLICAILCRQNFKDPEPLSYFNIEVDSTNPFQSDDRFVPSWIFRQPAEVGVEVIEHELQGSRLKLPINCDHSCIVKTSELQQKVRQLIHIHLRCVRLAP